MEELWAPASGNHYLPPESQCSRAAEYICMLPRTITHNFLHGHHFISLMEQISGVGFRIHQEKEKRERERDGAREREKKKCSLSAVLGFCSAWRTYGFHKAVVKVTANVTASF